jgi:hypothetical protein
VRSCWSSLAMKQELRSSLSCDGDDLYRRLGRDDLFRR